MQKDRAAQEYTTRQPDRTKKTKHLLRNPYEQDNQSRQHKTTKPQKKTQRTERKKEQEEDRQARPTQQL